MHTARRFATVDGAVESVLEFWNRTTHLNYYLSGAVCGFRLRLRLSAKIFFSSKMDQIRKFGEQTSRILEFKPEGLDF